MVLCDDLIEEILSRVPEKSLIELKCVCKGWNSLMSDPSFIKLHLRKSAALSHIRLMPNVYFGSIPKPCKPWCTIISVFNSLQIEGSVFNAQDMNILRDSFGISYGKLDKYLLVGSCNGLDCVVTETSEGYHVRFWNTAARAISGKSQFPGGTCGGTKFGFGYDPLSDNYKVVGMSRDKSSLKTEVKIYGMGDSCWRNLQGFPALSCLPNFGGVYLRGTLNWVAIVKDAAKSEMVIISVDLGKETCRQLILPESLSFVDLKLGVVRDSLCVWQRYKHDSYVIWQMRNFGDDKSWIQIMNFKYPYLRIDPYQFPPMLSPLCMLKNSDIFVLLSLFGNHAEYQTIADNQKDHKLQSSRIPATPLMYVIDLEIFPQGKLRPR